MACLSHKWNQMVFTHAEHFNITNQHDLTMINIEDGVFADIVGIFFVTIGEEQHCSNVMFGGFEQAFAVWVFAHVC